MTKFDWRPWVAPITWGQIIERTWRTLIRYAHEWFMTSKGSMVPRSRKHKATVWEPGTPRHSFQSPFLSCEEYVLSQDHGPPMSHEVICSRKTRHKSSWRSFMPHWWHSQNQSEWPSKPGEEPSIYTLSLNKADELALGISRTILGFKQRTINH